MELGNPEGRAPLCTWKGLPGGSIAEEQMHADGPNFTIESHEVSPIKTEELQESGIGEFEDGLPFKG